MFGDVGEGLRCVAVAVMDEVRRYHPVDNFLNTFFKQTEKSLTCSIWPAILRDFLVLENR